MIISISKTAVLLGGVLSACFLAGCGPAKGSVTGKVTLDGKPLKGGRVEFVSQSGGQDGAAMLKDDGTYEIPTLFAGEYAVAVHTEYLNQVTQAGASSGSSSSGSRPPGVKGAGGGQPKTGPPVDMSKSKDYLKHKSEGSAPATMPGDAAKQYVKIPDKYENPDQSGLKFTATGATQTHDIPLASK